MGKSNNHCFLAFKPGGKNGCLMEKGFNYNLDKENKES